MNEITKSQDLQVNQFDIKANEYLKTLGFKFSDTEAKKFLEIASAYQLNPFKREIYGVQGWDSEKGANTLTIIVGYETYLKRAERTGKLNGIKKTAEFDKDGNLISATVYIYRKDWEFPFEHTVYFNEFARKKKDGSLMKMWQTMPVFMLQKVALAQAFRMCFPDELGGLPYTSEELSIEAPQQNLKPAVEMPQAKVIDVKPEKIEAPQEPTKPLTYEEIFAILDSCLNVGELASEWKRLKNDIKALNEDDFKALSEFKEIKKDNLTLILKPED